MAFADLVILLKKLSYFDVICYGELMVASSDHYFIT